MKRKFSYKIQFDDILLLALGFGLAFFDMTMLQKGINLITEKGLGTSAFLAVAIATIANTFALEWGKTNGRNNAEHIFNKKSIFGFIAWVAFGLGYCAIEVISTLDAYNNPAIGETIDENWWLKQIGGYVLLAFSYIFSGLAIQKSARDIWKADASACRSSEAEFNLLVKKIAKDDSKINYMLTALENYNQNYKDLDEQYATQAEAIRHAEDSVINEILGKTLQENPDISPSEAHKVVEQARKDFRG